MLAPLGMSEWLKHACKARLGRMYAMCGNAAMEVVVVKTKQVCEGPQNFRFAGLQVTDLPQFDFFRLFHMNEDLLKKVPDKVRKRVGI